MQRKSKGIKETQCVCKFRETTIFGSNYCEKNTYWKACMQRAGDILPTLLFTYNSSTLAGNAYPINSFFKT